jgi:hypothetical protein
MHDGLPVVREMVVSNDMMMVATYATCSVGKVAVPPIIRIACQHALVRTRRYAALENATDREVVEWSNERYREEGFPEECELYGARPGSEVSMIVAPEGREKRLNLQT